MVLLFMRFARFAKGLSVGIESAEGSHKVRLCDPEGSPSGHHHTDRSAPLALDADARGRRVRLATVEEGAKDFNKLELVDGAAPQLEVHPDVVGDRRGLVECRDVV